MMSAYRDTSHWFKSGVCQTCPVHRCIKYSGDAKRA